MRIVVAIASVVLLTIGLSAADFDIIKNPKPNFKEDGYVPLEKVRVIDADLGNGEYLFKPTSIAVGKDGVFVYDILQAKIFKFDPDLETLLTSFGGKGRGPAEFGGTGREYPVYLQLGKDGKLYANDYQMRKTLVFDTNGKYIKEFRNISSFFREPMVDASGNLYVISVKNKVINILNQEKDLLSSLNNQERSFDYLFEKPGRTYLKVVSNKGLAGEVLTSMTIDSKFLLYFFSSSKMVITKGNRIVKEMYLWPEEALSIYRSKLKKILAEGDHRYIAMFSKLFTDDNPEMFFMQFGINRKKGINTLYQFNINGKLIKIFFVEFTESSPFTRFEAKWEDRFYAIESDKLIKYKERKK